MAFLKKWGFSTLGGKDSGSTKVSLFFINSFPWCLKLEIVSCHDSAVAPSLGLLGWPCCKVYFKNVQYPSVGRHRMPLVSVSMSQVWEGRCVPGNPCWDNRRGQIPCRELPNLPCAEHCWGPCWLKQTACAGYAKNLESPCLFSYKRGFFEDFVVLLLIKWFLSLCNHCATQAFVKGFCLL